MFEEWRRIQRKIGLSNIGCSDVEINDFNKTSASFWVRSYGSTSVICVPIKKVVFTNPNAYFSIRNTGYVRFFFALSIYHNEQVVLNKEYDGSDVEDYEFEKMFEQQ